MQSMRRSKDWTLEDNMVDGYGCKIQNFLLAQCLLPILLIKKNLRSGRTAPQDSAFSSPTPAPPGMTLPSRAWVWLNRLRTGVGRFRSCLYKWDMASSVACECGAEEQIVDHVVLQYPIHRLPHALHGLTVLDDETTEWLLNTFPEI